MHEVRTVFDKAIEMFECLQEHCSSNARIICDPQFESAICKIQQHQILNEPLKLTNAEAKCVEHLKVMIPRHPESGNAVDGDGSPDELAELFQSVKRPKGQTTS